MGRIFAEGVGPPFPFKREFILYFMFFCGMSCYQIRVSLVRNGKMCYISAEIFPHKRVLALTGLPTPLVSSSMLSKPVYIYIYIYIMLVSFGATTSNETRLFVLVFG